MPTSQYLPSLGKLASLHQSSVLINIASKLRRLADTARHGAREGDWQCGARACLCGVGNTARWVRVGVTEDWSGGGTGRCWCSGGGWR